MARMRITPPSMLISWISATPATGVLTATRRVAALDCSCTNMPVAFWPGTAARTQGSVAVV